MGGGLTGQERLVLVVRRPGLRGTFMGDRGAVVVYVVVLGAAALLAPQPFGWVLLALTLLLPAALALHARRAELAVAPGRIAHRRLVGRREHELPPGARLQRVGYPGGRSWGGPEDHAQSAVVAPGGEVLVRWIGRWEVGPERLAAAAGLPFEDHLGEPLTDELRATLPWVVRRPHLVGLAGGLLLTVVVLALA